MGSSDAGEQVTTTTLPDEIMPFLETGLTEVLNRFRAGPTAVPEFSDPTLAGIEGLTEGSPLLDALGTSLESMLNPGDALENPMLQDTFQQASNEVLQALDSRFGASGRDVGAALPRASIELQNLGANLFGSAFESERNRQVANQQLAAQLIPGFTAIDPERQLMAGQILENREREVNAAPDVLLSNFVNQMGGLIPMGGSTSSTPLTSNPFASGLGGALAGAELAGMVPGLGPAVGAGIGGIGSLIFG